MKRVRLTPEARRAQLLQLGVRMLATRTLEDLSVDDLAEQAGISRGLLFHYFDSKQEFHLAVVREAARQMLAVTEPDPSLPPPEQLRASLKAFVDYVSDNRDAYVSLVRGAASGDAAMRAVFEETRTAMADRVLANLDRLGLPPGTRTEIAVRGWIAFVEEAVISWLSGHDLPRAELLDLLAAALPALALPALALPGRALPGPSTGDDLRVAAAEQPQT